MITEYPKTHEDALKALRRRVQITKEVRFQAHLRLERRHHLSSYFISFLSLCVISISLLPNIVNLTPGQNQVLLACSIVLSVFIIILSFSEGAKNFYHRGEILHQNARDINRLFSDLEALSANAPDLEQKIIQKSKEYHDLLNNCHYNHDNVDYIIIQIRKPDLFVISTDGFVNGLKRHLLICKAVLYEFAWMIFPTIFSLLTISVALYFAILQH